MGLMAKSRHNMDKQLGHLVDIGRELQGKSRVPATDALLVAGFREGMPLTEIADMLGTTRGSVTVRLHRLRERGVNLPTRYPNRNLDTGGHKFSADTKHWAVARYVGGNSSTEVARRVGCHHLTVLSWVRQAGHDVRKAGSVC